MMANFSLERLNALRERLNALDVKYYIFFALFLYSFLFTISVARYDFNPSSLLRIGHYYAEQNSEITPEGAVYFVGNEEWGGNGYDGQIFYYYARTLLMKGVWPRGFSDAYRAPRVGYPLLVAPFSLFGSWATVFGMIFIQLFLVTAALAALYRMLPHRIRYLSLFFVFSPFTVQSGMLLLSDSIMISLQVIGFYYYRKIYGGNNVAKEESPPFGPEKTAGGGLKVSFYLLSLLFFSLAVLTKESSLFLFFPLGLAALFRRDVPRTILMLLVLVPMILWQFYLKTAHGMVPASFLKIFLSPLSGVGGLFFHGADLFGQFISNPSLSGLVAIFKQSARFLLFFLLLFTIFGAMHGVSKKIFLPFRLAILLVMVSVIMADYYYFWGIYENISRMFTPVVSLMIFLKWESRDAKIASFFALLFVLTLLVFVRIGAVTPQFPYDLHETYSGPDYSELTPVP